MPANIPAWARKAGALVVALVAIALGYREIGTPGDGPAGAPGSSPADTRAGAPVSGGSAGSAADHRSAAERILSAYNAQQSDLWIEGGGRVQRVLSDDSEGSRHQRFILELANGHTVLVAHNIDLAQRVPLRTGDEVTFYGEYEWNDRGGVVHWTHHNPRDRSKGGWIDHKGTRYR